MFRKTLTYWFCMIIGYITFMIPVFGVILELLFLIALMAIQQPISILDIYHSLTYIFAVICAFSLPMLVFVPFFTVFFIFTDGIIYVIKEIYKYTTPSKISDNKTKPKKYSKKLVCLEIFLFILFLLCFILTSLISYNLYFKHN